MWAHALDPTVTWWEWVLLSLATAGFWALVACVLRRVLTRPDPFLTSSSREGDAEGPDRRFRWSGPL